MHTERRPASDLLDIVRVLLLVQGAVLIATTIEAIVWGLAFAGAPGVPVLMSGTAAAIVLIARVRLRPDRRRTRRLVCGVELFILATFVLETGLAIALAGTLPPAMAILTQLVVPISIVMLLRRSVRTARVPMPLRGAAALEGSQ